MNPIVSHPYPHVKRDFPHLSFVSGTSIIASMALGKRIKRARVARKLSQQAVADRFGISRAAVAQWESDTTRPDHDRLVDLAALLNLNLDDLLTDGGAPEFPRRPLTADAAELLDCWEALLPRERDEILDRLRKMAAHNREVIALASTPKYTGPERRNKQLPVEVERRHYIRPETFSFHQDQNEHADSKGGKK